MSAADATTAARKALAQALYSQSVGKSLGLSPLTCHELAGLAIRKSGFPELAASYEAASALGEIAVASAAANDPAWPTAEATAAIAAYATEAATLAAIEFIAPLRTDTIEA